MSLNARHFKKLASLSAIGAGAIALTADKAEADSFITYIPVGETVGFAAGDQASVKLSFTVFGGFPFTMSFFRSQRGPGSVAGRAIFATGTGAFGLRFAATPDAYNSFGFHTMDIVAPGKTWFQASSGSGRNGRSGGLPASVWLGARSWTFEGSHWVLGNGSFTNQYALFNFGPYPEVLFGWVELSYSVTNAWGPACGDSPECGDPNGYGPQLTIVGYAYGNSEAVFDEPIPAGAGATPEPDTFAATGLAALALGAVGMRRWRAARQAA